MEPFLRQHGDRRLGRRGWPRRACVRTRRFRFDCNVRQDGAPVIADRDGCLIDVVADPTEVRNLATDPAYRGERLRLEGLLETFLADAVEPVAMPVPR